MNKKQHRDNTDDYDKKEMLRSKGEGFGTIAEGYRSSVMEDASRDEHKEEPSQQKKDKNE